jgi:hypothetical protein
VISFRGLSRSDPIFSISPDAAITQPNLLFRLMMRDRELVAA